MGLYVHSLTNIPKSENKVYLYPLEYGWHEPIAQSLKDNFEKMANNAAKNNAVVIKGTELTHFENEVFSYHQINNERGENILPAILRTNTHPSCFLKNNHAYRYERGLSRESTQDNLKLILIPLKKFCSTTSEVISLIEGLFIDIDAGKDLSEIKIAKEAQKGIGSAIVDALILEPNISGAGFSFKKLKDFLNGYRKQI